MHLALASFDPQLIKGEILQYYKGLIASTKNKHILTVHPQEKKTLSITSCNLEIHLLEEHPQKNSLQILWKGPDQVLLTKPCAIKFQGIDSWINVTYLEKALNPDWTCISFGNLKVKISWN